MMTSAINMSTRALALALRFSLSIYLVKFSSLEIVGVFGLISGVIGAAPAVLGCGLNYFLNRETVGLPLSIALPKIRDRLLVTSFSLLISISLLVLFAQFELGIPGVSLWKLSLLLILEVIAFDIHMSLISLSRPVLANALLFIRSAVWIPVFMLLGQFEQSWLSINGLVSCWLGGLGINFLLLVYMARNWPWGAAARVAVSPAWIRNTTKNARLIHVSDVAGVAYIYADRFIANEVLGLASTGIYVFFWTLANAVQLLVSTAFIQTSLPRLVHDINCGDELKWRSTLRDVAKSVLLAGFVLSFLLFFALKFVYPYLGRQELSSSQTIFAILLASSILRLLSDVLNFALASRGFDRGYALVNILGIPLSLLLTVGFAKYFNLFGIGLAGVIAAGFLLLTRFLYLNYRLARLGEGRL